VNRLCRAAGISRAGYYRFRQRGKSKRMDMDLRSQMQRVALRWPTYGYRRVHAELLRRGWTINHKRVLRLLREDNRTIYCACGGESSCSGPPTPDTDCRSIPTWHAGMVLSSMISSELRISPT
jgi:hypothetical protein